MAIPSLLSLKRFLIFQNKWFSLIFHSPIPVPPGALKTIYDQITTALWLRYPCFADRASKYRRINSQSHPCPTKSHPPSNEGQAHFSANKLSPPPSVWRFHLGHLQPAESSEAAVWVAPKKQRTEFCLNDGKQCPADRKHVTLACTPAYHSKRTHAAQVNLCKTHAKHRADNPGVSRGETLLAPG